MRTHKFTDIEENTICEHYLCGMTIVSLANIWICHFSTVIRILIRHSIKRRKGGFPKGKPNINRRRFGNLVENNICLSYKSGKSLRKVGDLYKCDGNTVRHILERHNIKRREVGRLKVFTTEERFHSSYQILENGCWQWLKVKRRKYGYFCLSIAGKKYDYLAHRYSYELRYGKIPQGKHLHHICPNKTCINPEHLQLTTKSEHPLLEENNITAINARKTHCKHGHEFTEENTYIRFNTHHRSCRKCQKQQEQKYKHH